jgi:hypothetical protein
MLMNREPFYKYTDYKLDPKHSKDADGQPTIIIICEVFPVINRGLKGTWVRIVGKKTWVPDTGRTRPAYPTTAEAWDAFYRRKLRQVKACKARLSHAERLLDLAVNSPAP